MSIAFLSPTHLQGILEPMQSQPNKGLNLLLEKNIPISSKVSKLNRNYKSHFKFISLDITFLANNLL